MSEILSESISRKYVIPRSRYQQWNEYTGSRTDSYGSPTILAWTETRSGSQNPRWRKSVEQLKDATTEYSRLGHVECQHGYLMIDFLEDNLYGYMAAPDHYWERYTHYYGFLPDIPVQSSDAYNIALGNFLQNVNSALSPFKGMTFLGELKETLHMLRHPASGLRDGFCAYIKRARPLADKAKRRNPRSPGYGSYLRNASRSIADMWLEFAYGWMPLLGDIEDASKAYKKLEEKVETSFVKGESSVSVSSQQSTGNASHPSYLYYTITDLKKLNDKCKFKGVVKHQFDGILTENANRVISLSGFSLAEFIPTVWELVPYSFIVDYFTNIGEILNSITTLNANLAWYSCSRWTTSEREVTRRADLASIKKIWPKCRVLCDSRPSVFVRTDYRRTHPVLTVPGLVLHWPGSPWKWANLAALIGAKVL